LAAVGLAIPGTPASAGGTVKSVTSCGGLNGPGTYRLDANVTGPTFCFGIGNNVTFLLNGHTISSGFAFQDFGIITQGSGDTILGPGKISGFGPGIDLFGGGAKVRGVTATRNGVGIFIESAGNDVRGNVTTGNGVGILAETTGNTGNTIIGNSAQNNGTDLEDDNANCGSNVWRGNDFGTANLSCIH
jgi:hypothetical protein